MVGNPAWYDEPWTRPATAVSTVELLSEQHTPSHAGGERYHGGDFVRAAAQQPREPRASVLCWAPEILCLLAGYLCFAGKFHSCCPSAH